MSLASVGMHVEAEQQMQYLVRVGEQTYGAQDPRMSGIHDQLGDFYMQTGLAGAARDSYRDALTVVEKKLGRNDLATIPPLRAYARSYRQELLWSQYGIRGPVDRSIIPDNHIDPDSKALNPRYLSSDGERALKRAIKTLDSNPARPTWLLFDTLLDLGDWYMIKSNPGEAMPYYRRAAHLLDEVESEHGVAARAKLSFPVQVYYPMPSAATRYRNRPADEVDLRVVHVAFTVAADGSVEDARIVESNASERHAADTLNAVRNARYRPKFVSGEPVKTIDVSLRQVFRLRRERERETE
jgi:TonB family protein